VTIAGGRRAALAALRVRTRVGASAIRRCCSNRSPFRVEVSGRRGLFAQLRSTAGLEHLAGPGNVY